MTQVLINLLSRAIKFSPTNGHVSIQVKDTGNKLTVQIQDDTPPLERNEINRIVNRPDWIKEQFNAGREDLALGLRIAKELVEMHGGCIWTESSEAKRNMFCFTVPNSSVRQEASIEIAPANAN